MHIADIWPFIASPFIGLLIGSFPTAYIVSKLISGIDPRKFGSGSVSTRNTIRAAGFYPWGLVTFSIDGIKGMLAAALVEYLIAPLAKSPSRFTEYYVIICSIAAVVGHCWMPYLKFQGGKGLGTYLGLLFYFYWPTAFIWAALLFLLIRITGFSGFGACWAASFVGPIWYIFNYISQKLSLSDLPLAFWPHVYFTDVSNGNSFMGWQFIILYSFLMWLVILLRHIPEFNKIKRGEAQVWKSLKRTEMLK